MAERVTRYGMPMESTEPKGVISGEMYPPKQDNAVMVYSMKVAIVAAMRSIGDTSIIFMWKLIFIVGRCGTVIIFVSRNLEYKSQQDT